MPRKKTIQSPPLSVFTIKDDDGNEQIVEVRDETCLRIGRGLDKQNTYYEKLDEIFKKVAEDYIDSAQKKSITPRKDYLKKASEFAKELELRGDGGLEGTDDSSLRKRYYKDINKRIKAFKNLIERNKTSTNTNSSDETKPLRGLAAIAANKENPN